MRVLKLVDSGFGRRGGYRLRTPRLPVLVGTRARPAGEGCAVRRRGLSALNVAVEEAVEKPVAAADNLLRLGG